MKKVKLSDISTVTTGNTPSTKNEKYYDSKDIFFIKPDEISSFDSINYLKKSKYFLSGRAREKARIANENSVLVTCIGNIGKVGFVTNEEVAFNQQINALNADEKKVTPKYLAYIMLYNQPRLQFIANGPVVSQVNKTQLSNFEVCIHDSLLKQQGIVKTLDNIQSIIAKREKQLQELDNLIQSIFMDMFSYDIRASDTVKLSDITNHISSGSTPRGGKKVYQDEGIPIIRSQDVLMNELDLTNVAYISEEVHDNMERSKVKNRDVLLNITGASIGRTAVYYGKDDSANKNQHVASIRLNTNKILPEFLSYYFSTDYFQEIIKLESSGGTREALNYTQIGNFDIPTPPLEKQENFVESLEEIGVIKEKMQTSLEEMNILFDALMQKAFAGELV